MGNTASGVWTNLPDSILAKLFQQEIYLNVHSAKYPAGEIRGQLIPVDNGIGFTSMLDGSQETPVVSTPATGTGWAVLRDDGSEIEYSVTVAGYQVILQQLIFIMHRQVKGNVLFSRLLLPIVHQQVHGRDLQIQ